MNHSLAVWPSLALRSHTPLSCFLCMLVHSLGEFPPHLLNATAHSLFAAHESLLLLRELPTRTRRQDREVCNAAFEWEAAGGGRRGRHALQSVSGQSCWGGGQGSVLWPGNGWAKGKGVCSTQGAPVWAPYWTKLHCQTHVHNGCHWQSLQLQKMEKTQPLCKRILKDGRYWEIKNNNNASMMQKFWISTESRLKVFISSWQE